MLAHIVLQTLGIEDQHWTALAERPFIGYVNLDEQPWHQLFSADEMFEKEPVFLLLLLFS